MTLATRRTGSPRDLAARYTTVLRQMYRSKSERISADQLALLGMMLIVDCGARGTVFRVFLPA